MKIEELRNRKTALGLTNEMISRASDIPLSTVQKIMSGATKAPRKLTLEAIESVLYAEEQRRAKELWKMAMTESEKRNTGYNSCRDDTEAGTENVLKETAVHYSVSGTAEKKDGEYTLDDYYALPDERRVELIDGVFYGFTYFSVNVWTRMKENVKSTCLPAMSGWTWTTGLWCSRIFL